MNLETHPPKAFIVESKKKVARSDSAVTSHTSAGLKLADLMMIMMIMMKMMMVMIVTIMLMI